MNSWYSLEGSLICCRFFARVDRVLRRSLGVSETAKADASVKPAPPVDPESPFDEEQEPQKKGTPFLQVPDEWKDQLSIEIEEIPDDEPLSFVPHDEL